MSTHARIGIEGEDGTIRSVYLHADGYPSEAGRELLAYHNSAEAALALVNLGYLSTLCGPELAPEGERDCDKITSYQRWRNEPGCDPDTHMGRVEWQEQTGDEWYYVYGPRGWEYKEDVGRAYRPLTVGAIARERARGN